MDEIIRNQMPQGELAELPERRYLATTAPPRNSPRMQSQLARITSVAASLFELQVGNSRRLLPMEGMRGLSAFLVFFVHFNGLLGSRAEQTPLRGMFHFLGTIGHCGVDVFFALSGYIIYGLLLEKRVGYFRFVWRRICRLYPTFTAIFLLYAVLSVVLPTYSKLPDSPISAALYLAANFLMLPGIFPIVPMITVAWSLSYELCFYLTLPLLMRWLKIFAWPRFGRVTFFLVLCATCLALSSAGLFEHSRLIMFGCGIVARETTHLRVKWGRFGDFAALIAFVVSLALVGVVGEPILREYCGPFITTSKLIAVCLFVSTWALGYVALAGCGPVSQWFSWRWLRWFGNISYSYYLTHGIVLHVVKQFAEFLKVPARLSPLGFVALGLISFAATVVGSSILFLLIEKRFSFPAVERSRPSRAA